MSSIWLSASPATGDNVTVRCVRTGLHHRRMQHSSRALHGRRGGRPDRAFQCEGMRALCNLPWFSRRGLNPGDSQIQKA